MSRNRDWTSWISNLLLFSLFATIGGSGTGFVLGAIGSAIHEEARLVLATVLGTAAVAVGLGELHGRRLCVLQCSRETPQRWLETGPLGWAVRNGAALGFGASTRIGFSSWYTVPLTALLLGDAATGAMVYGTYGLTRGLGAGLFIAAAWVGRARFGANTDSIAKWALKKHPVAQRLAGAHLLAFGLAVVATVGM